MIVLEVGSSLMVKVFCIDTKKYLKKLIFNNKMTIKFVLDALILTISLNSVY